MFDITPGSSRTRAAVSGGGVSTTPSPVLFLAVGLAAVLAIPLLITAGCDSTPEAPGLGESVIITRPETDDTEFSETQRVEAEEKIRQVEIHLVREEFDEALGIVDDLLDRELPNDLRGRLQGLRLDVRRRRHERPTVEGRLRAERDLYAFGDDIRLVLTLINRTDREVEIKLDASDASTGYLFLRILRRQIDVYGNVREDVEQGQRTLPGNAVLAPGASRWSEFVLPAGTREHDGLTEYVISGHVRPSVVEIGDREDHRSIPLRDVTVKVLPRNYEPLAEDPLGSVAKALDKRAAVHLLVAAELVSQPDRDAAVRILIEALRTDAGGMARAVIASLRRLTGVAVRRFIGDFALGRSGRFGGILGRREREDTRRQHHCQQS